MEKDLQLKKGKLVMKKGSKIKYYARYICDGKDVVAVGYLVSIDGDWAWVARTKEDCEAGFGFAVPAKDIIRECKR